MKPFIKNDIHVWDGASGQVMVSDEAIGKLSSFADIDKAIDYLFLNGHRDEARALNAHKKEQR